MFDEFVPTKMHVNSQYDEEGDICKLVMYSELPHMVAADGRYLGRRCCRYPHTRIAYSGKE